MYVLSGGKFSRYVYRYVVFSVARRSLAFCWRIIAGTERLLLGECLFFAG